MREIMVLLLISLLAGCSQPKPQPLGGNKTIGVQSQRMDGAATATSPSTLYNHRFPNCNKVDSQPASPCSGVMIRVTEKDPNNTYKVWDPSPTSKKNGGVNFFYLRVDNNFGRLAWDKANGYILYPVLERPATTDQLQTLCIYPMDSHGRHRSSTAVCVARAAFPEGGHCQDANVLTGEQFKAAWEQLADAKYNQRDFYNSTYPKLIVPIIPVELAASPAHTATFTYVAADQAVTK